MIKLIACDLDGTLLFSEQAKISDETLGIIERLIDKGIYFVVASGRPFCNEYKLFSKIQDRISYIAENGSICIHGGKVVSKITLPEYIIPEIFAEIRNRDDFAIMISREEGVYIEERNAPFVKLITTVLKYNHFVVADALQVTDDIMKIALKYDTHVDDTKISTYLSYLKNRFGQHVEITTSGNGWLDFTPLGGNKGVALKKLTNILDIKLKDCMAFGDNHNDIEMLRLVGHSYAMSNSAPGIIPYAKHTTNSVDDVLKTLL